jgi:hypothetical protein
MTRIVTSPTAAGARPRKRRAVPLKVPVAGYLGSIKISQEGRITMAPRSVIVATLLLAPLSVRAADLPKQGTDSYTTTYVIVSSSQMKAGDRTITAYEGLGITRNDNGGPMFNDMGARCLGTSEMVGKDASSRGTCVETDKDGDEIYSTYQSKGLSGTHTFFGGTGKYAGLSGTADYTTQLVKGFDGRGMAIVRHKATWQRP